MQDDETITNDEVVEESQDQSTEETEPNQNPSDSEDDEAQDDVKGQESNEEEESEESQEESEDETPEERPPSRREQLRVQQLLKKYGPPEERSRPQPKEEPSGLDYRNMIDADEDVYEQLDKASREYGQRQYHEGLKRAEFIDWKTSLKIDAPKVEQKFPILDPNNEEAFHPAIADTVNRWYMNMSGFDPRTQTVSNPDIGYAEFVEGFMELVEETAGQKVAQSTKNITRQAAQTAVRPDGSQTKRLNLNKPPEQMTDEELQAVIAQVIPKK